MRKTYFLYITPHSYQPRLGYIGVRGFHSRVILSLGAMGLGSGHLEIFVFRLLTRDKNVLKTHKRTICFKEMLFLRIKKPLRERT